MLEATLVLTPQELAYLIRCVERELVEYEEASWQGNQDDYAMLEAIRGEMVLRVLRRVEQEQVIQH
jgi:hypothetical protein